MENLLTALNEYEIEYSFNSELEWKSMGYPDEPANFSEEAANIHFKTCGHSTFCINGGVLYYCDAMFGAEANTGYKTHEDDVIRIEDFINIYGKMETKKKIFKYIMGEINTMGCPSFCRLCKGVGEDNNEYIEVGS